MSGTSRFPWRGVLLGLAFEIPTIFWVASSEVTARVFISSWSLTLTAVFALLLLLGLNGLLTRVRPGWELSRTDLLVVFIMLSSTSLIYGYCLIQGMIPAIGGPHWLATEQNHYEATLWPLLPDWAFITDDRALRGLFEGYATPPLQLWLPRWLAYGAFLLSAYAATLGITQVLSRQWIVSEKLTFPICALPLEMTTARWPVMRSKLMWLGFAIPAVLETLVALRFWFPVVPAVQMKHMLHPEWFQTRPWTVLQPLRFGWTPFIVGLAYVASTEISFSCWFFVVFNMALRVLGVVCGWSDPGGGRGAADFPFLTELTIGGFLAFAGCSLWMARAHLAGTLRAALGLALPGGMLTVADEERGYYRLAYVLWLAGTAGVMAFCMQLGIRPLAVVGVFSAYFLIVLTLSRLRAEAGPAWAFGPDRAPHDLLVWAFGSSAFDRTSLAGLALTNWFFADVRFATLPSFMESLKIGHDAQLRRSHLAAIIGLATLVAVGFGMVAVTNQYYSLGAATAKTYGVGLWIPRSGGDTAMRWLTTPTNPDWQRRPMVAVGAAFTTGLHVMRQKVLWWPFHPVGFVMAHTGAWGS
ncbi:MAG: hypothetical protein HYU66_11575 [Armatimonadetes bacterium]|nr:hypothetical protein [Armatimonadota bacterium]